MKISALAILAVLTIGTASAQQWEFGATGGGGLFNNVSASGAAAAATAGFAPGFATGVFVGQDIFTHFTGEIRYEYMQSDLKLSSGGQTAQFNGLAHVLHYDMVYHFNTSKSRVQFYGALGGGVKAFFGTGTEEAFQPLSQYGYFTKTNSIMPMGTVAAGVTYRIGQNLSLRTEIRDYVTGFPTAVLTPAPGVRYGSILHDVVPMVSIVYEK
jgi:hypothetical protein